MWHVARFVVGVGEGPRPHSGGDTDDGGGRGETRCIVPVWHLLWVTKIIKLLMNTEEDHAPTVTRTNVFQISLITSI